MLLSGLQGRLWNIHPGSLEDPCSQVCLRHHLRARRLWRLQADRRGCPRHPRVPGHQGEEGALPGQGGFAGC